MTTNNRKPRVVSVVALDGLDDCGLLAIAASVASGLEAPLGSAILESVGLRDIEIRSADHVHERTRTGVAASVAGQTVVVGNAALFSDLQLSTESLGDGPERLRQHGQYVLFVAVDGRTAGFFGVVDDAE